MNGNARNTEVEGFSPMVWHALVAALLLALITAAGCQSGDSNPSAAPKPAQMGPFAAPKPAATAPGPLDPIMRAPQAVRDSYFKDHRDDETPVTVTKVQHRMMPDNYVHYTLTSKDSTGKTMVEEYRADGLRITPKK
jgi:hypothetical protein